SRTVSLVGVVRDDFRGSYDGEQSEVLELQDVQSQEKRAFRRGAARRRRARARAVAAADRAFRRLCRVRDFGLRGLGLERAKEAAARINGNVARDSRFVHHRRMPARWILLTLACVVLLAVGQLLFKAAANHWHVAGWSCTTAGSFLSPSVRPAWAISAVAPGRRGVVSGLGR